MMLESRFSKFYLRGLTRGATSTSKKKTPCNNDVDVEVLCSHTSGYSGAEIASVVREATLHAIEHDPENATEVKQCHLLKAVEETVKPQITTEMLKFYDDYRKNSGMESI